MYDIKFLEEEWEKYNKKRRRPFYITVIMIFVVVAIGYFLNDKNISLLKLIDYNKSVSLEKTEKTNPFDPPVEKSITKLEIKKEMTADPKVAENKTNPVKTTTPDNNPMEPDDVFIEVDERVKKPISTVAKAPMAEKVRPRKKIHFEITDASNPAGYKEIERRFSVAPDTDDSLFLARMYYRKGNYRKSAYWALQTNKLNGNIEESWLIFARSKAKTGQKNEAIRVLSQYVKKSNSVEAKKLLKKLSR